MDPLRALRSLGGRVAGPAGAVPQALAGRAAALVAGAPGISALLDWVDVNALLARVYANALLGRVDVDRLLARVDMDALLGRVDVDSVLDRVDVDRLLARVDVDRLLAWADAEALAARAETAALRRQAGATAVARLTGVNGAAGRASPDGLAEHASLDAPVAGVGGLAGQALDMVRSQAVLMDEIAASWVDGLLRRRRFSPGEDDASVPAAGNCGAMGTYRHADDGWDRT